MIRISHQRTASLNEAKSLTLNVSFIQRLHCNCLIICDLTFFWLVDVFWIGKIDQLLSPRLVANYWWLLFVQGYVQSGEKIHQVPTQAPTFTVSWHPKKHLLAYACDDKVRRLRPDRLYQFISLVHSYMWVWCVLIFNKVASYILYMCCPTQIGAVPAQIKWAYQF